MKTKIIEHTLGGVYTKIDIPYGVRYLEFWNTTATAILIKVNNTGEVLTLPVNDLYVKGYKESNNTIEDFFFLTGVGTISVEYEV